MTSPFGFHGRIGRLPYALGSAAVFFSQHLVTWGLLRTQNAALILDIWFAFVPLRALVVQGNLPSPLLLVAFGYLLIVAWILAALAYQRAADAGINEWIAAAAFAPFMQVPVVAYLSSIPTVEAPAVPPRDDANEARIHLTGLAYGVIACVGVTIAAVALSTMLFSVYGAGLFVIAPFVIGAITAYLMNLRSDLGARNTNLLLAAATAMAAIGLIAVALEGIVCIILIAPLAFGLAVLGGMMGRAIANSTQRPPSQMMMGFAVLPLMFALEAALPPETSFDTRETITVSAPPAVVWASLLRMETIEEPAALPFRLGVAHPIRGEVVGEGIGAMRRGEFSTGIAIERITEWVPNRTLAFIVEQDVPSMRELSPYHHVHAPHATGYFRTVLTRFDLVPQSDGGTQIVERTSHQLKLDPVLYWLPMVRWIVHMNNSRVLRHVKYQAETAMSAPAATGKP
jgi:uncharacterized membrane protein YhaH (DUF805 family)